MTKGTALESFREAGFRKTPRPFHQRRAPRCCATLDNPESIATVLVTIQRIARDRSCLVALYVSPVGHAYALAEDRSVSHQVWARAHHAWLRGWFSRTATLADIEAAVDPFVDLVMLASNERSSASGTA